MLQIVNKRVAEKDYVITQKRRKLVKKHDYNIGMFFVEFWPKPRVYYLGKLTKVFSNDVDDETEQCEIIFLKKVENSIDPSGIRWDWPMKEEKGIVDVRLCFAGACLPDVTDTSHFESTLTFKS